MVKNANVRQSYKSRVFYFKKTKQTLSLFISSLINTCNHEKGVLKKTCQTKKQNNITIIRYLQALEFINNYCYRQRQRKLETAAEETMACAKYPPQA